MKSYTRSNYLSDSGILAGNFDRSGSLSTNLMWTGIPQQQTRATHWTKSSLLPGCQAANQHSWVSKQIQQRITYSLITYTPGSSFGTKKRQRVLTVCMAAGVIKGLIYRSVPQIRPPFCNLCLSTKRRGGGGGGLYAGCADFSRDYAPPPPPSFRYR